MKEISSLGTTVVRTIEAIGKTPSGKRIQGAWLELAVVQCGCRQPGQVVSASALLAHGPNPSDASIDATMKGNIRRSGTYQRVRAAIKYAARLSDAQN
jgi:isoquinoline 1-oxidoreductase alpha subunit